MLQDPEANLEEVSIAVYANSDQQAQRQGERYASSLSDADTIVICLGCRRITRTTGRYACTMRIEVRPANPGSEGEEV